MDKVLNPPPPPPDPGRFVTSLIPGLDASKIVSGTLDISGQIAQTLATIPDGFKELGHLSEQTASTFDKWAKGPW
jgi:hypothetical protein